MDLNIGSLGAKRDVLLSYIDKLKEKNIYIIAICVQEVWSYNKTLEIPGYVFYHNTRPSTQGGGVGIFVCDNFKSKKLIDCMYVGTLELIAVSMVTPSNKKLNIVNCYHVPDSSAKTGMYEHFENFKLNFLQQIKLINTNINTILLGDFNICIKNHRYKDDFLELMYSSGFFLANTLATRISNSNADSFSFIDNIFVNSVTLFKNIYTSVDTISDHNNIYISINTDFFGKIVDKGPKRVKYRDFGDKNIEKFRIKISQVNWDEVMNENDVIKSFDNFYSIFLGKFNEHFKEKYKNFSVRKTPLNPWFTPKLRRKRNIIENLKLHARINPLIKPSVNRAKNKYFKEVEKVKRDYYAKKIEECEGDSKKVWKTLNGVWNPGKKAENKVEALRNDKGEIVTDCEELAGIFNHYYNNFTNDLNESMPIPPTGSFEEFLGEPATTTFTLGGGQPRPGSKGTVQHSTKKKR